MIEIDELNHATILYNLYKRYVSEDIYTYVGPTLLVVNPFQNMEHKYPAETTKGKDGEAIGWENCTMKKYMKIIDADNGEYYDMMKAMPPHSYAISALAHKQMTETNVRQGIVISGESGAGKTVSAKQCMAFLCKIKAEVQSGEASIGDKILNTNPVLEAFGNAMTVREPLQIPVGRVSARVFSWGAIDGAYLRQYNI